MAEQTVTGIANTLIKANIVSSVSIRFVVFLSIWWILSDGNTSSFWVGIPAVTVSVALSITLLPPIYVSWFGLVSFIPFFLVQSFKGAFDVALRVFHPKLPISPSIVEYRLNLPSGLPQVMMMNVINLIPGTLSVYIKDGMLSVHVLSFQSNLEEELASIENRIEKIFKKSDNI